MHTTWGGTLIFPDMISFAFWVWRRDSEGARGQGCFYQHQYICTLRGGACISYLLLFASALSHLGPKLEDSEMRRLKPSTGLKEVGGTAPVAGYLARPEPPYTVTCLHEDKLTRLLEHQHGTQLRPKWVSWPRQTQTSPILPEPADKAGPPTWSFNFLFFASCLIS